MKRPWIIISLSVIFFLTALTFYINRVIFPTVVKKIAVEQAQAFLKRKVEIESVRFNWLHGVVISRLKIYQKDSSQDILAQAEKVSIGVIFIPGFKQHKVILPFINVESPSLHLIRQKDQSWNFSDLLVPPPAGDKPSPVDISVGSIHLSNGKVLLESFNDKGLFSEKLDQIDLSIGLSLQGISFKGSIAIPQQKGLVAVDGSYQPLNQTLKTSLIVKNIKPADYLALSPIELPVTLTGATINEVDARIHYAPEHMDVSGRCSIKQIDVTFADQHVKTDLDIANAQFTLNKSAVFVKGSYSLANTDLKLAALSANGALKADIDELMVNSPQDISFKGSINSPSLSVSLPSHQSMTGQISATIRQGKLNQESITADADLKLTNSVITLSGDQRFSGDLLLNALTVNKTGEAINAAGNLKLAHAVLALSKDQQFKGDLQLSAAQFTQQKAKFSVQGDLQLDQAVIALSKEQRLSGDLKLKGIRIAQENDLVKAHTALDWTNADIALPGQSLKGTLHAPDLNITLDHLTDLKLTGPVDLTDLLVASGKNTVKGSLLLKTLKISFDQGSQVLDAQTQGNFKDGVIGLDKQGSLTTQAHFDVHANYPLKAPDQLTYNGSLSLADTRFEGLPLGTIKNINLTADFKTDAVTIQHLTLNVLDTALKASGSISHLAKPLVNLQVESDRFDLAKIQTAAPELLKPYGLTVNGETSFKLTFNGLASDALNGEFNALAVLTNVNVTSAPMKQEFKNMSATLKADGKSLSWDNFTGTVMDHPLTSSGTLSNFKNPKINATVAWNGLDVSAKIQKTDNLVELNDISGQYQHVPFHVQGSIDLSPPEPTLNIDSRFKLKLEELSTLMPELKKSLDPLKISGTLSGTTSIKGSGVNWKTWTIKAGAQSDLIRLAGYQFDTVNIDIAQTGGKIEKANITSKLYEGDLNIVTTADLTEAAMPFETAVHVENVNLAKLKNDTGAKDEDLRGFIAFTSMVKGTVADVMKVTGKGSLNVSQGYLMKKEFSSLFMIPELSNLVFTEASANFDIADQQVSTENFALKSEGAILNGKGTIGFDQRINFELHPEFNVDAIAQSESMRKGPSALIASAAGKYLTFTVTGTLAKPQIRTIKRPGELIKKTGEILKDNVGQILQGIFQ